MRPMSVNSRPNSKISSRGNRQVPNDASKIPFAPSFSSGRLLKSCHVTTVFSMFRMGGQQRPLRCLSLRRSKNIASPLPD